MENSVYKALCETMNDDIYHYGVIGMKWGIRRGRADKAYAKASKKLNRLDQKVDKTKTKAERRRGQADSALASILVSRKRQAKFEYKARKASAKNIVAVRRAQRWYNNMDKAFANTDISLTEEQKKKGQRYVETMKLRTVNR